MGLRKPDGGHLVLTFVLVGSVAGVVLAVTTIYLLKRHRRSQHKLVQLATGVERDEASKDYQVSVCACGGKGGGWGTGGEGSSGWMGGCVCVSGCEGVLVYVCGCVGVCMCDCECARA